MFDNSTQDTPSTTFDNSAPESPTTWDQVKAHIPIILAIGGALTLFVSMHTGAFAVATIAALHVALGGAIFLINRLRQNNNQDNKVEA